MYGFQLDKFAIAGFNDEPVPAGDMDDIELRAYEIGRNQACLASCVLSTSTYIEQKDRRSDKDLAVIG